MKIVRAERELAPAARTAASEAERYFGDGRIYAEAYVERPRHIEVQILGDGEGGAIHLFERECSIQRRFQKIVEEAPAPNLPAGNSRGVCCDAAVRLARAARYKNAGTIEFILGADGRFFFLEMNTRLQVEHPVTEMILGLDLVRAQIEIAAGRGLPFAQDRHRRARRGDRMPRLRRGPRARLPARDRRAAISRQARSRRRAFRERAPRRAGRHSDFDPMLAKLVAHGATASRPAAAPPPRWKNSRSSGSRPTPNILAGFSPIPQFRAGFLDTGFVVERAEALRAPAADAGADCASP